MSERGCDCWTFNPDENGECLTCGHDASYHLELNDTESECGFVETSDGAA